MSLNEMVLVEWFFYLMVGTVLTTSGLGIYAFIQIIRNRGNK